MENTPDSRKAAAAPASGDPLGTRAAGRPRGLKSYKFLFVGLAWAFGYPATACLIGYTVFLSTGTPAVA